MREKRRLKSTGPSRSVLDWSTRLESRLRDKKERLSLKLPDLNKRRESRLIVKSKSSEDSKSKSSKNNRDLRESRELKRLVKSISRFKLRDKNNTSSMLLKENKDLNN